MLLQNVFLPEFIKIDMDAEYKKEAFEELVKYYCQADNSKSHDEILSAITEREAKMSTGIRKGVAVPHGKTKAVKSIRGVLGISKKGINYDTLDGEPVYLIFLIISPLGDSEKHLRFLKHLAELMEIQQFQTELRAQKDTQSVYKIISKYEEIISAKKMEVV
jgi:PTS system fructose-specific IIC component/PTS system nitrogen regulatory IIA component